MKKIVYLIFLVVTVANCSYYPIVYDQKLKKIPYVSYYNYDLKSTIYETYTVYKDKVNVLNLKKRPTFRSDKTIPKKFRSYTSDYRNSGYDRGHLAPDASFDYNQTILKECYLMPNIVPQLPNLNRKVWKYLEIRIRNYAKYSDVNVSVILKFGKKTIGKHKIYVPKTLIKTVEYKKDNENIKECYRFFNNNYLIKRKDLTFYKIDCNTIKIKLIKRDKHVNN